jgi:hypothetical protein
MKIQMVYSTEDDADEDDEVDIGDDDPNVIEIPDPYAAIYANVPSETQMSPFKQRSLSQNHRGFVAVVGRYIFPHLTQPQP